MLLGGLRRRRESEYGLMIPIFVGLLYGFDELMGMHCYDNMLRRQNKCHIQQKDIK